MLNYKHFLITLSCFLCIGCSHAPYISSDVYDPIEPVNRAVFSVNLALETVIVRPVSVTYRDWAPKPVKTTVNNVLTHWRLPMSMINNALQGDWEGFELNLSRFFVNSIIGIGGLINIYNEHPEIEDFGQTLAVWGVKPGPYLVLPLLGPSNLRDFVGFGVDRYAHPITWANDSDRLAGIHTGLTIVNEYYPVAETLFDLQKTSVDYYAKMRSLYNQRRVRAINDGKVTTDHEDF